MALPTRTSGAGVELIKSFEGFRARATRLPDGSWIVGFGHTAGAREGLRVTRADAELVLRHHDLKPIEDLIGQRVLTPLTQNEFDALVSFAFNIGPQAFLESNVLALLNSGERLQAAEGMTAWRKAQVDDEVRVVDALVRRRAAEKALFLEHPSGRIPVPGALLRPQYDPGAALAMSRERAVVIEARTEDGRISAAPPRPASETAPQAAARAVSERMSKLLGEEPETGRSAEGAAPGVPTADEITRAVSALAEPDGAGEDHPDNNIIEARQIPAAPPRQPDEPAPQRVPPAAHEGKREILRPPALPPSRSNGMNGDISVMRWLPYALLSGLGLWGVFEGVRRTVAPSVQRFPGSAGEAYVGPLLAFGSALLSVLAIYYLYRAITRQD
ncbi:putative lysozyme [Hyphomonas adhaerens MHS-3]|uniref:Lysozyme n=1 Tax=Hyphomonas adhaerens MHS-3 TaxID=1280949 RepID=A0A069E381_9PROT|nr:glycoside hydrolase family protein [Hyphomonas adhaerens]KCZ84234.1 putative lysozyme [Hyphomonas adhaerens MHS-3]